MLQMDFVVGGGPLALDVGGGAPSRPRLESNSRDRNTRARRCAGVASATAYARAPRPEDWFLFLYFRVLPFRRAVETVARDTNEPDVRRAHALFHKFIEIHIRLAQVPAWWPETLRRPPSAADS